MAPTRILRALLVIAALLVCTQSRAIGGDVSSDGQPYLVDGVKANTLSAMSSSGVAGCEACALIPASEKVELFADGSAGSGGLLLIQEVKRTRSLDGAVAECYDNARLSAWLRMASVDCQVQRDLLLTLSSLHIRLQV